MRTSLSRASRMIAILFIATWSMHASAQKSAPAAPESDKAVETAPRTPTPEEIAAWITELDDDQYVVRERATARLLTAGAGVLEPLLATANGDLPEPADRAVWILRKLSIGSDVALRRPALEKLVQLKQRPQVVAAAANLLAEIRHQEAVVAIKELGGQFLVSYPGVEAQMIAPQVLLDEKWRGNDEQMKLFGDLLGLRRVCVIDAKVTPKGLGELHRAEQLAELWLYRTKLKSEDIPALTKALPRVAIDFRRGALLGVGGNREGGPGPAIVTEVRAGSVAAKAGIRVGDVVKSFHGKSVRDFQDLTSKIAEHYPGDEVKLQILRDGQQLEIEVKLGEWSSEQILSQITPR